uniref:Uncharacterized protein n=1 Tax=Steinernema glaseri TaxID=37863 RepID=A0A1I7YQ45_9BILA
MACFPRFSGVVKDQYPSSGGSEEVNIPSLNSIGIFISCLIDIVGERSNLSIVNILCIHSFYPLVPLIIDPINQLDDPPLERADESINCFRRASLTRIQLVVRYVKPRRSSCVFLASRCDHDCAKTNYFDPSEGDAGGDGRH